MSLIGSILLNEIVHIKGISSPADILTELDKALSRSLNCDENNHTIDDGMDMALCSISKDYSEIQFAGAYNPLFHISDGELNEFKANRFPIGGNEHYNKRKFTNHTIKLKGGDVLYVFTDGYTDQFGGEKGKKFMTKRFKEHLLNIYHKDPKNQKEDIEEILFDWKKGEEQVDDILVMGIKIPLKEYSLVTA
jgi:serine phosphatase RsbU (regulator of sigma subunit)